MSEQEFQGVLESARGGGAVVELPAAVTDALGGRARMRVRGTINAVEFASSTMSIGGGRSVLGVHKATREAAGIVPGDTVTVRIAADDRPREVVVPPELQAVLDANPQVAATFNALSFTRRREYAESIAGAKREETRQRRLDKMLRELE